MTRPSTEQSITQLHKKISHVQRHDAKWAWQLHRPRTLCSSAAAFCNRPHRPDVETCLDRTTDRSVSMTCRIKQPTVLKHLRSIIFESCLNQNEELIELFKSFFYSQNWTWPIYIILIWCKCSAVASCYTIYGKFTFFNQFPQSISLCI